MGKTNRKLNETSSKTNNRAVKDKFKQRLKRSNKVNLNNFDFEQDFEEQDVELFNQKYEAEY